MKTYATFAPNVEVHGGYMLSFVECINKQDVAPSLERMGIAQIDPAVWYPQRLWVAIFNDMLTRLKGTAFPSFVAIGMKLAEAPFPPEIASATYPEFMSHLSEIYQGAHRGGDPGSYHSKVVSDHHVIVTARAPYPDDFVYGMIYGFARRFLPKGTSFTVKYDDATQRADEGGEYTVLHITWK